MPPFSLSILLESCVLFKCPWAGSLYKLYSMLNLWEATKRQKTNKQTNNQKNPSSLRWGWVRWCEVKIHFNHKIYFFILCFNLWGCILLFLLLEEQEYRSNPQGGEGFCSINGSNRQQWVDNKDDQDGFYPKTMIKTRESGCESFTMVLKNRSRR